MSGQQPAGGEGRPSQESSGGTSNILSGRSSVQPAEEPFGQFIFHLHPESDSKMEKWLNQTRDLVAKDYGMDDSYLYPPHVSMSGWVYTTHQKMDKVCIRLREMIRERLTALAESTPPEQDAQPVDGSRDSLTESTMATASPGGSGVHEKPSEEKDYDDGSEKTAPTAVDVSVHDAASPSNAAKDPDVLPMPKRQPSRQLKHNQSMRGYRGSGYSQLLTTCPAKPIPPDQIAFLGRILSTDTGYVLNDLSSAFLHQMMLDIDYETADDVVIKGKPINHITLANCRDDAADRDAIMEIYTREFHRYMKPDTPPARWQIVVFEMKRRTPKGKVEELGPHTLNRFATIPVWLTKGSKSPPGSKGGLQRCAAQT